MKILVLLTCLLLSGCASHAPAIIDVPVMQKMTASHIPQEPYLPIYNLTSQSTAPEIIKAYVASVVELKGWGTALTLVLQGYQ